MNAPRFPAHAVAQIRKLHRSGMLNVRAWAQAYNVSLETVRRIARGDTYRDGLVPQSPDSQVIPPQAPPQGEPDGEALAASFARLAAAQAATAAPPAAQDLLDEMLERGRGKPGLPGVSAPKEAPRPPRDPFDPPDLPDPLD